MQIFHGSSRIVIALPLLGIAIKIAKCRPIAAIVELWKYHKAGGWRYTQIASEIPVDSIQVGPRKLLFKGFRDNLKECWFYWRKQNPFCQPTYFTFFGLLNIQKFGNPYYLSGPEFWKFIERVVGPDSRRDAHHLEHSDNFCLGPDGRLRALDYGSSATQWIIRNHGARIMNERPPEPCPYDILKQPTTLDYE